MLLKKVVLPLFLDSDEENNDDEDGLGIKTLFADLPSNMDMARSMHNTTASRKSLRRQKSARAAGGTGVDDLSISDFQPDEIVDLVETNTNNKKMIKSMAVPMDKRKSVR